MHWQFNPPFLPMHTALLAAACAAAITLISVKRGPRSHPVLLAIRGLVVGALAIILLNPTVSRSDENSNRKNLFLILLDTSRSMCTADAGAGQLTRFAAAKRLTSENHQLLAEIGERYDVRYFGFSDKPIAITPERITNLAKPNGDRTNLGAALAGSLTAGGIAGGGHILLVSDGRDTDDSFPLEAAHAAKAQGIKVSTLCIGKTSRARDLQVVARRTQVFSSPGQTVQLAAEIRDTGIARTRVRVDLMRNAQRVSSQTVLVEPGRKEIEFPVAQKKKGLYRYSIAVMPSDEEQNESNNRANIFLSVMNAKARVLFLEGRPSWDSKFLAQTLRNDPSITLDVIYKLTDAKYFAVLGGSEKDGGIALPRTPDQMGRYDLIIVGKGIEEFYDDTGVQALKQWLSSRGGNLLFLRGRADERSTALREIEPVTWADSEISDLRIRLTQEGRSHPAFAFAASEDAQTVIKKLPSLISASRVKGEKALAVVLARAENAVDDQDAREMATLVYQRYGQGKVMTMAGQGMWRWAFLPPDLQGYRKVYDEFWSQVVRWMVSESDFLPGQNLSLRTDRNGYAVNDIVTLLAYRRGSKGGTVPPLTITLPDGHVDHLSLARADGKQADFTATYRPAKPGEYVASIQAPGSSTTQVSAMFTANAGSEEDLNRSADPDLMRQIAIAGGGQALTPQNVSDLPGRLRAADRIATQKEEPRTAWDRPWVLAGLVVLLGIEWWMRRRMGMV